MDDIFAKFKTKNNQTSGLCCTVKSNFEQENNEQQLIENSIVLEFIIFKEETSTC